MKYIFIIYLFGVINVIVLYYKRDAYFEPQPKKSRTKNRPQQLGPIVTSQCSLRALDHVAN